MARPGLKLTDGMIASLRKIRAGKEVSPVMMKSLVKLKLINPMEELTDAGHAVVAKPIRSKNSRARPKLNYYKKTAESLRERTN